MNLPTSIPEHDQKGLWQLQNQLLDEAQRLVGQRDLSKKIYPPAFHENGPHIRNTPELDGAFIELGPNSKVFWPTVVYEMAHEIIHLLNPIVGYANWLEEGVAVEFSIHAQTLFDIPIQSPTSGPYFEALNMVRSLPGGTFSSAKLIRGRFGSLSAVTFEQLFVLFPACGQADLRKLSEQCVPR